MHDYTRIPATDLTPGDTIAILTPPYGIDAGTPHRTHAQPTPDTPTTTLIHLGRSYGNTDLTIVSRGSASRTVGLTLGPRTHVWRRPGTPIDVDTLPAPYVEHYPHGDGRPAGPRVCATCSAPADTGPCAVHGAHITPDGWRPVDRWAARAYRTYERTTKDRA
ncbi:hypothetical protein [Streptomonospora wellingtoniae]|uniref:Uncharacterized protein n=1 Tax=Streptomonospora wellingtoniae TaxID=3075544 RepID=A0ABU2KUL0_9ACTN|nr:hypothetical protein [Streptomonospora sp. DSM 45055]MDT0302940.1 hypothetical protein [Streptomonospora sp. DSM 45055]